MNNFSYKNLCPFKWFVLQNFPFIEADFDAITNWQLFCKLGEEMNKIIEKVNQAGVQTENLTNAFIDLQNYVNNYFENLDIQEEINNKLDEMVEDGTLQEIISIYLNSVAIQGFNDISSLKEATSLQNGSFAKTYGRNNINDGFGAFYYIREIQNTDIIDNYNIVALSDSNLVAVKTKENIENEVEQNKKNFANFFFSVFFNRNTLKMDYFTSLDGISWAKQNIKNNLPNGRDPSLIYIKELQKFVLTYSSASITTTFNIGVSSDLINWEWHSIYIEGFNSNRRCWAPDLLYKDGRLYVTFSVLNTDNENMQVYLTSTDDLITFTNWSAPYTLALGLDYVIDSQIKFIDNLYYLICKNGQNENVTNPIQIFTSENLINWTVLNGNIINAQVEGCNLVPYDEKFLIEVDMFIERGHAITKVYDLTDTSKFNWVEANNLSDNLDDVAHGSILYVDDIKENEIIKSLNINFSGNNSETHNINGTNINENLDNFVILPGYIYTITGNPTIQNLLNPFNLKNISMKFATNINNSLTIVNIGHDLQHMTERNIKLNNSLGVNEQTFIFDLEWSYSPTTLPILKTVVDIAQYWNNPTGLTLNGAKLSVHGTVGLISLSITATENISGRWVGNMITLPSNLYNPISGGGGMICGDRKNIYQMNANNISANLTLNANQNEVVRIPFIC